MRYVLSKPSKIAPSKDLGREDHVSPVLRYAQVYGSKLQSLFGDEGREKNEEPANEEHLPEGDKMALLE